MMFAITQYIVMACGNFFAVLSIKTFFPDKICHKVPLPEHLIADFLKIFHLIVINADKYHPVLGQQAPRHEQTRVDHRAPV